MTLYEVTKHVTTYPGLGQVVAQAELFGGCGFGGWDSGGSIYTTLSSRLKPSTWEGESICYPQPSTSQIIPPMGCSTPGG